MIPSWLILNACARRITPKRPPKEAARWALGWIAPGGSILLAVGGGFALVEHWKQAGPSLDINSVILIFLLLGLVFYWKPIAYVEAVNNAARVTGPLILQYPLYGGIMGHHDGKRVSGCHIQGVSDFFYCHKPAVLDVYLVSGNHPVHSQRRRSLGGPRAVRPCRR